MENNTPEKPLTKARLNILSVGNFLLTIFLISVMILGGGLIYQIYLDGFKEIISAHWGIILLIAIGEFIIFWIGIIAVYSTSIQLGIKMRIIGAICGMIPIVHIFVLMKIILLTGREASFEKKKEAITSIN